MARVSTKYLHSLAGVSLWGAARARDMRGMVIRNLTAWRQAKAGCAGKHADTFRIGAVGFIQFLWLHFFTLQFGLRALAASEFEFAGGLYLSLHRDAGATRLERVSNALVV
jgi:hypothetical protein